MTQPSRQTRSPESTGQYIQHNDGTKSKIIFQSSKYPRNWNRPGRKLTGTAAVPAEIDCAPGSTFVIIKNSASKFGQPLVVSNSKIRTSKNG